MNRHPGRWPAILCTLVLAGAARGGDPTERFDDSDDDVLLRRTDPGADGPLNPDQILPNLLSCTLSKWQSPTAATNPFNGFAADFPPAHLFRIDLAFNGLINPPGPLEISGQHDPFRYGPSPLYGFLELNIDHDRNTGGDPTPEALNHFLANVGRFGTLPHDSINSRAVTRPGQTLDHTWQDAPQFELSGAEFTLKLCGCEPLTIISTSTPGDTTFSAGDTWVVSARFFERSHGFNEISRMNLVGGLCEHPTEYSPVVSLRFSHSTVTDTTTVSFVYALDQVGAGLLAGQPFPPPANLQLECDGNSGSMFEAMKDVADAAALRVQSGSWPSLFARTVSERWASRANDLQDYLDPTDWRVSALFGTTYSATIASPSSEGALYVWTDVGFDLERGDIDGNGVKNIADRNTISTFIAANDGSFDDADGIVNGYVFIQNFGPEFDIHDVNGDGVIDREDMRVLSSTLTCSADWNFDDQISVQDIFDFLGDWFALHADFNGDHATTIQDIFDFLASFFSGCP